MAVFWLQTVIKHDDGFVRFAVDAPYETVKEFANALSEGEIVACDKIWTVRDDAGRKIITGREEMAIGADYVGMIQKPHDQPIREVTNV